MTSSATRPREKVHLISVESSLLIFHTFSYSSATHVSFSLFPFSLETATKVFGRKEKIHCVHEYLEAFCFSDKNHRCVFYFAEVAFLSTFLWNRSVRCATPCCFSPRAPTTRTPPPGLLSAEWKRSQAAGVSHWATP